MGVGVGELIDSKFAYNTKGFSKLLRPIYGIPTYTHWPIGSFVGSSAFSFVLISLGCLNGQPCWPTHKIGSVAHM